MKLKLLSFLFVIMVSLPTFSSGPAPGAGGDPIERPDWWKGDWPPKNWGDFQSGWNHWAPTGVGFPCEGSGCDYLKDWIRGAPSPRSLAMPSVMLFNSAPSPSQAPSKEEYPAASEVKQEPSQEAKANAQSEKAKQEAKCGNCFTIGFTPVPTAGLDFDRNRYIIYLGSDEVLGDETISAKTGTKVGPFAVVEYGVLRADVGVKGMFTFGPVGNISIGLKLSGSSGYESSRIATTIEEAKNFPRIKTIPRNFNDFSSLPLGTIIVSRMTGGIAFEASAVAGYVANAAAAFAAEGEWMVRVAKPNNYEAVVSITDVKNKEIRLSAGLALPSVTLAKRWSNQIFFSFQIDLSTPDGIKAYEDFFKGKLISIQHAARRNSKLIKQLKEDQFNAEVYKPLIDSKSKSKSISKTAAIGLPFIGAYSRNMGSENFVQEELRYLSDQELTELGQVEKGTMLHSLRGSFNTGKNTTGLASTHRERLKEFNVKLEEITFPGDILTEEEQQVQARQQGAIPKGFRRIISKFEYKFHKNDWTKKDWDEELKFMARRTGFKEQLFTNMPNPVKDKSINFVEFQASLKISEKALRALSGKVISQGQKNFYDRVVKNAEFNLEKWFSNPENQNYEQCDNLIACKSRITSNTREAVNTAVENLAIANELFKKLDSENNDQIKKDLVKTLVKFGSGFVKNQFTVGVFLQELTTNRMNNQDNDFAYCFQWKGSNFKENQFVLYPSVLRTDRNQCYLKEETQIDQVAKKNDRDLFGSEFILD